jgi:hypothetical protein
MNWDGLPLRQKRSLKGRRYHVEYDSPASGRGPGHQSRLSANDPEADVILIIIPEGGGVPP